MFLSQSFCHYLTWKRDTYFLLLYQIGNISASVATLVCRPEFIFTNLAIPYSFIKDGIIMKKPQLMRHWFHCSPPISIQKILTTHVLELTPLDFSGLYFSRDLTFYSPFHLLRKKRGLDPFPLLGISINNKRKYFLRVFPLPARC